MSLIAFAKPNMSQNVYWMVKRNIFDLIDIVLPKNWNFWPWIFWVQHCSLQRMSLYLKTHRHTPALPLCDLRVTSALSAISSATRSDRPLLIWKFLFQLSIAQHKKVCCWIDLNKIWLNIYDLNLQPINTVDFRYWALDFSKLFTWRQFQMLLTNFQAVYWTRIWTKFLQSRFYWYSFMYFREVTF